MYQSIDNQLKQFDQNNQNYIILNVGDSELRAHVHQWAHNKGYRHNSEYLSDGYRIKWVRCQHCDEWNDMDKITKGNDFDDHWQFLIYPDDHYIKCSHCNKQTHYDCDDSRSEIRKIRSGKPTGYMIIMKKIEPGYKRLTPTKDGSWKRCRHNSRRRQPPSKDRWFLD